MTRLFEAYLEELLGLDVASLGETILNRALQTGFARSGCTDATSYVEHVRSSAEERKHLIEDLIVPESWFFRDREPFLFLQKWVLERKIRPSSDRRLQLLSLPCGTGEEAYSLAMALSEAGFSPHTYEVLGIDVSIRSLEKAQRAEYGSSSFRGENPGLRERFFEPVLARHSESGFEPVVGGSLFRVREGVRAGVSFQSDNAISPQLLPGRLFDVIFCRNLLIYLTAAARAQILANLERLLAPDGVIFSGGSEFAVFQRSETFVLRHSPSFAFQRREAAGGALTPGFPSTLGKSPGGLSRNSVSSVRPVQPAKVTTGAVPAVAVPGNAFPGSGMSRSPVISRNPDAAIPAAPNSLKPVDPSGAEFLRQAQEAADRGDLDLARNLLEEKLGKQPSASGFTLLGTIHLAAHKNDLAESAFQKALYLDPQASEALFHLSLLAEETGRPDQAKIWRERLERLGGSEKKS